MNVTVKADELERTAQDTQKLGANLTKKVWGLLVKLGGDVEQRVKRAMPVDTGRARASFGRWTDRVTPGKHPTYASSRKQMAMASEADSIRLEEQDKLRVTVGSNLPYIEALNEGHSQQAPIGFIDTIADEAGRLLEQAVAEAVNAI